MLLRQEGFDMCLGNALQFLRTKARHQMVAYDATYDTLCRRLADDCHVMLYPSGILRIIVRIVATDSHDPYTLIC